MPGPGNRILPRPGGLRIRIVLEEAALGQDSTFGRGVHDVHGLRHPLVGPALRILHGPHQAIPAVGVAIAFAGDALEGEMVAARRFADLQQHVAEERLLVDFSRLPGVAQFHAGELRLGREIVERRLVQGQDVVGIGRIQHQVHRHPLPPLRTDHGDAIILPAAGTALVLVVESVVDMMRFGLGVCIHPARIVIRVLELVARAQRASLSDGNVAADVKDAAHVGEVALGGGTVPHHLQGIAALDPRRALRLVLIIQPRLGPAHAADDGVAKRIGFLVLGVTLIPEPLGGRGQHLVHLHVALAARNEAHLLAVGDLGAGDAVDHGLDPVHHDDGPVHLAQPRLVVLRELLSGGEGEVLARLAPPRALGVVILGEPALQAPEHGLGVSQRIILGIGHTASQTSAGPARSVGSRGRTDRRHR